MGGDDAVRWPERRWVSERMQDETKVIKGIELRWDTERGTMESIGHALVAFWLDPSLLNMLAPLRDEIGTDLFRLLVAESSSRGTREDYEKMLTAYGATFEEGFLGWGSAVGVVGWGRFELPAMDRDVGTATVIVRSPWELVMQERLAEPWGCPFLMGKMIGLFRYALGVNCWARERTYHEHGEPVVEFSLFPSSQTIETELARLRADLARVRARRLQEEIDLRTELHRSSEERIRAILASMNDWVFTFDPTGRIGSHHVPEGTAGMIFPAGDATGKLVSEVLPEEAARALLDAADAVIADGQSKSVEYDLGQGSERLSFCASLSPLRDANRRRVGVTAVVRDTTEQRKNREQRAALEAQLQQAQKMEAIGQLTGGVAHDFNNLLTAIHGNLELAVNDALPPRAKTFVERAIAAAESAATLTHRLLAFSRKQPLSPHRVDAWTLLTGMEMLLLRTLGEKVEIEIVGESGRWQCEVDGAQLESAILNLAINARDAMPEGGKITIETRDVTVGAEQARGDPALPPGQYVMVAVSDTGIGMSDEVRRRAFEPFFTTKQPGRGSGLGLSMVYGFVRQSHGSVRIESMPGAGTTVRLYLPRSTQHTATAAPIDRSGPVPQGDGSWILVVEDDAPVRRVSVNFLRALGYQTVDCENAEQAIALLEGATRIDLLFTDVILRGGMNGAKLAEVLQRIRPGIPVLFTSGYTESAILHDGRLEPGVHLVEKPFTQEQLGRYVHAALHASRVGKP